MASRDLTSVFVEYRNAAIRKRPNAGSRLHAGGGVRGATDTSGSLEAPLSQLPPKWVDDVDEIQELIQNITQDVSHLNSLHASRLGSVFGKDLERKEQEIEKLTLQITQHFRGAERLLQHVGKATRKSLDGTETNAEEIKVGANVQRNLAKKLQELSAEFRQKQRQYLKDVQTQKNGGLLESEDKFGIDLNGSSGEYHNHEDMMGMNGMQSQHQRLAMVDDVQGAVQSRDLEIAKIAESIEELSSIFRELAVLVIDQGTILDRIDYNMETVVEHTKEGIQQLEKAESQQKSARPLKCIVCLLSTIAVLLIILVMKHWH